MMFNDTDYSGPGEENANDKTVNEITLHEIAQSLMAELDPKYLSKAEILEYVTIAGKKIAIQVRAFVYAEEESVKHLEIEYPDGWWEAFKDRWLPEWALKRWPVRYICHVVDVEVIYPEVRPQIEGHEFKLKINHKDRTKLLDDQP